MSTRDEADEGLNEAKGRRLNHSGPMAISCIAHMAAFLSGPNDVAFGAPNIFRVRAGKSFGFWEFERSRTALLKPPIHKSSLPPLLCESQEVDSPQALVQGRVSTAGFWMYHYAE
ncbi:hypothetical protein F4810DRAFT_707032 [Camillea tinctor]|nr:hypothetical protein F4810DRAFT_707032 [Camillea tinctor]